MSTPFENSLGTTDVNPPFLMVPYYVRDLLGGSKWGDAFGSGVTLTYSFMGLDGAPLTVTPYGAEDEPSHGFRAFNGNEQAHARAVLGQWSNYADVHFVEVSEDFFQAGDIRFGMTSSSPDASGQAYLPADFPEAGDVWLNADPTITDAEANPYFFRFLLRHEIGHALGLKHPFEGDFRLPPAEDTERYTSMSYTADDDYSIDTPTVSRDAYTLTPMLYDIAAIQALYGANMNYRTGTDSYTARSGQAYAIWDAGGVDTLSAAGQRDAAVIDLRAGHFSTIGLFKNNVAIAFGVVIENARGGDGNDRLIGNAADNELNGAAGNDVLLGGAGDDRLAGGPGKNLLRGEAGNDVYTLARDADLNIATPDPGVDTVRVTHSYVLGAQQENLTLIGGSRGDGVGNAAANLIIGNGAANVLRGENGSDELRGGGGDDQLYGGPGGDVLSGDGGRDVLRGEAGNDVYFIDAASEIVLKQSDPGRDRAVVEFSYRLGPQQELLNLAGDSAINGSGNAANNVLTGNSAANRLSGAGGADVLNGLDGSDTLAGGAGADIFVFSTLADGTHLDRILDYLPADDSLRLSLSAFPALSARGGLAAGEFRLGASALDADDHILYDRATGTAFYDSDGSGALAALAFARFDAMPLLRAAEFDIV